MCGDRLAHSLDDIGLPLYANILQGICLAVPVIKEELLSCLDGPLGKDSYPVVSIHHHNFGIAIGVHGVVGKADFISFASGINNKIIVEVEEET